MRILSWECFLISSHIARRSKEGFEDVSIASGSGAALIVCAALTVYLGVLPARVLDWATSSALSALAPVR